MSKQRWSLVAALITFTLLAPCVSAAHTQDSYFVGAWVFDRKICTNPTPPRKTGRWDEDVSELIRVTKYKFFGNGKAVVDAPPGKVQVTGRWSFSGNTLKTNLNGSEDVYRVLSTSSGSFVALERSKESPMTWLRCR
jgi:hypothetical protein